MTEYLEERWVSGLNHRFANPLKPYHATVTTI